MTVLVRVAAVVVSHDRRLRFSPHLELAVSNAPAAAAPAAERGSPRRETAASRHRGVDREVCDESISAVTAVAGCAAYVVSEGERGRLPAASQRKNPKREKKPGKWEGNEV